MDFAKTKREKMTDAEVSHILVGMKSSEAKRKRKLDECGIVRTTTTKEEETACRPSSYYYYLVSGLFCDPVLTSLIDKRMRSLTTTNTGAFTHVLVNLSSEQPVVIVAVFVYTTTSVRCATFDRFSGNLTIETLTRFQMRCAPTEAMMWKDDSNPRVRELISSSFQLTPETDYLHDFQPHVSTLNIQNIMLPNSVVRPIMGYLTRLSETKSCKYALCVIPFLKTARFDVVNIVGRTIQFIRVSVSGDNILIRKLGQVCRVEREMCELKINSPLWDVMDADTMLGFANTQFTNIRTKRLRPSLPQAAEAQDKDDKNWSHKLSSTDGDLCMQWLKFVRTKLSPQVCFQTPFLTVELFHSNAAWTMFEGQIMRMELRGTPIEPRIMFHGIRTTNVLRTIDTIRAEGFDSKCTRNCVYGAGGTYCSPQLACALEYTAKVSISDSRRFVFACMVVPGKVCLNGQLGQPLESGQNCWYAHLSNGQQIYCAETILPFALLCFLP